MVQFLWALRELSYDCQREHLLPCLQSVTHSTYCSGIQEPMLLKYLAT